MTPDHPVLYHRVQWLARVGGDPGTRYTRRESTAERMVRTLKQRGHEAVHWPIWSWEIEEAA